MEFPGLSVAQINDLRGRVLQTGARMHVVKNRLLKLAAAGTPFELLSEHLVGPNAVIFCPDDPIEPLKVVAEFLAANDMPPVKLGVVEGRVVGASDLDKLSKTPKRDELVALVVGGIASPLSGLVLTLNGLVSELVYTMQAVADKKAAGQAA